MKISVNKRDMTEILSRIQGITGRKSGLAITENVLIKADDATITIVATDLETGFKGIYPASVESPGALALNSRKLYEIARDFPTEEIILQEVENRWIQIGNHNTLYRMVGMNTDDFPEIPRLEEAAYFHMDSLEFSRMIDQTVFIYPPPDNRRPHTNGVLFEKSLEKERALRMVSTDGSRLSCADCFMKTDFDFPSETAILVPKTGLHEVRKMLSEQESVQIGFMRNHFILKKEKETVLIRLLEGSFPKYQEILEKGGSREILINRQFLLMMLKRMSILSSDAYKGVIFSLERGKFTIQTTNPDIGESKEDMDVPYDGPPVQAVFNPRFFIDSLGVMEEEEIVLRIKSADKPFFIEGNKEKRFICAIMPMRI
ncbi:MAG: DNA polymerase III subunit beta [Deltaproteobacteria bacterium]|nr:DNA polymerase III subunit beta [Deltaproteobacteria bacterium]